MTRDGLSLPLVAAGAASAFAALTLLRPARAQAGRAHAGRPAVTSAAPALLRLDLGRPLPPDVGAVVSSGWLARRGDRLHRGLDIPAAIGTPILAIDDGLVTHAVRVDRSDAGLWVAVRHPSGVTSRYLHLSRVLVSVGQTVRRGDRIGLAGDTGNSRAPHLHLDLRVPAAMLPAIERTIGTPRPGWGREMRPFGHSIPGEPWIHVDGYAARVRRDAEAAGIPLRNADPARNAGLVYRPVGARGEPYPEWVRRLKGQSGVYVIRERSADGEPVVVYVGQSSGGRLYDTLTRHLQIWRRWKGFWRHQYGEGHDPGLTYDRASVEVAVRVTSPARALDEEARLIRRLRPRDNLVGQPVADEVPF